MVQIGFRSVTCVEERLRNDCSKERAGIMQGAESVDSEAEALEVQKVYGPTTPALWTNIAQREEEQERWR